MNTGIWWSSQETRKRNLPILQYCWGWRTRTRTRSPCITGTSWPTLLQQTGSPVGWSPAAARGFHLSWTMSAAGEAVSIHTRLSGYQDRAGVQVTEQVMLGPVAVLQTNIGCVAWWLCGADWGAQSLYLMTYEFRRSGNRWCNMMLRFSFSFGFSLF